MATLNTLRTRGGVIVTIVIGLALIAFLLTDLLASGGSIWQSRKMRVGEIDGSAVGYIEYTNEIDFHTQITKFMYGNEGSSTQEQDDIRNRAWESLVSQYVIQPGLVSLGLYPGEDEQVDMSTNVYISPIFKQVFTDPSTGMFNPELMANFVTNIMPSDPSGMAVMFWDYLKQQADEQRAMSKYVNIIAKAMYATDLEAGQTIADMQNTYDIQYVDVPYSSIADSTIKVSKSEISAYYNKTKNQYRRQPTRTIEYVIFPLTPSDADQTYAKDKVAEIETEFQAAPDAMQYARLNSQATLDQRYLSPKQVDAKIAAEIFGKPGAFYGPVLEGDRYIMARQGDVKNLPDSVQASHIYLDATQDNTADSLLKVLKSGGSFPALAFQYSMDQSTAQQGGNMGLLDPQDLMARMPQLATALIQSPKGEIVKVTTPYGIHLLKVEMRSPMIAKAQIATVVYNVEPSSATEQTTYNKARTFSTIAAGSTANFEKAVSEEGVSQREAVIRNTDREVNGVRGSREIVKWAFNNDKGSVSQIFDVDGDYAVATLTAKTEEGYAPQSEVEAQIKNILIQQKKAEQIASTMTGSSLSQIATAAKAEVKEAQGINFESFFIPGIGVEQNLIGAICAVGEAGKVSKPVKGSAGVYVFEIDAVDHQTDEPNVAGEKVRMEAMWQNYLAERAYQAIFEGCAIKDNRVKFF